jgi:hypothetical protein
MTASTSVSAPSAAAGNQSDWTSSGWAASSSRMNVVSFFGRREWSS